MSEQREIARRNSQRRQLGRSTPRRFSKQAWHRFSRDRRAGLVDRVGGQPNQRQGLLISQMASVEWSALECEDTARALTGKVKVEALRLAAEYRRQLLLLDRDLARTIRLAPEPAAPKQPSLADIIAKATQNREAAE